MHHSLSICAIAALSSGLMAQASTTIPTGYDTKEGEYSRHVPLRYAPCRIQCGYDAKATNWKTVKIVKELWVRADRSGYLTTGFSLDMQVLLSSKGADIKTPSMNYKSHLGADVKVFMKKKTYKFAPFAVGTTFPNPWTIQMKGDAPFVALAPTFLVDWSTYASANQANVNLYVDASRVSGSATGTRGTVAYYGTACNPSNFYNYATQMDVGSVLRTYGYSRNVGDYVVAWLGAGRISKAIPGLTGCSLYSAPILFHPTVTKTTATTGYANFLWGTVPAGMKGLKVTNQMAAIDAKAGMRFSRGLEATFGDYMIGYPFVISHKYGYSSGSQALYNPDKDAALYGWIDTAIIFDVR